MYVQLLYIYMYVRMYLYKNVLLLLPAVLYYTNIDTCNISIRLLSASFTTAVITF